MKHVVTIMVVVFSIAVPMGILAAGIVYILTGGVQ
jgi:hypothetical protein